MIQTKFYKIQPNQEPQNLSTARERGREIKLTGMIQR